MSDSRKEFICELLSDQSSTWALIFLYTGSTWALFFAFFGEIYRNHVRLERNNVRLERKCCGQKRGQN